MSFTAGDDKKYDFHRNIYELIYAVVGQSNNDVQVVVYDPGIHSDVLYRNRMSDPFG